MKTKLPWWEEVILWLFPYGLFMVISAIAIRAVPLERIDLKLSLAMLCLLSYGLNEQRFRMVRLREEVRSHAP